MKLSKTLQKLEILFDELNKHLFDGEIVKTVITTQIGKKSDADGWCAWSSAWRTHREGFFYELNINPVHLRRTFLEVAETMLHLMVRLYMFQKQLGCDYNEKFKECAENHGLIAYETAPQRYSYTELSSSTIEWVEEKFSGEEFEMFRLERTE